VGVNGGVGVVLQKLGRLWWTPAADGRGSWLELLVVVLVVVIRASSAGWSLLLGEATLPVPPSTWMVAVDVDHRLRARLLSLFRSY
jgi:hypothetical protein